MRRRDLTLVGAGLVVLAVASFAAGQDPDQQSPGSAIQTSAPAADPAAAPVPGWEEPDLVFEREVFVYSPGGRRDPFKPLTDEDGVGPLFEDLSLRMIIYSAVAPGESVAVLADGQKKTYRVRRGDYVGNAAVVEIGP